MKQKEKLIEKITDLNSKLIGLDIEIQSPLQDLHPSSLINKFSDILDSLPNRVLAKIIREAKATVKELEEEKKNMEEE